MPIERPTPENDAPDLRHRLLIVLDNAVEQARLTRDEALGVLDLFDGASVFPPSESDLDSVFERQPKSVTRYRATRVIPPGASTEGDEK